MKTTKKTTTEKIVTAEPMVLLVSHYHIRYEDTYNSYNQLKCVGGKIEVDLERGKGHNLRWKLFKNKYEVIKHLFLYEAKKYYPEIAENKKWMGQLLEFYETKKMPTNEWKYYCNSFSYLPELTKDEFELKLEGWFCGNSFQDDMRLVLNWDKYFGSDADPMELDDPIWWLHVLHPTKLNTIKNGKKIKLSEQKKFVMEEILHHHNNSVDFHYQ